MDNLTDLLEVLNSITENMVPPDDQNQQPNYQLLKVYIDTIPNYDGNLNTLKIFINAMLMRY